MSNQPDPPTPSGEWKHKGPRVTVDAIVVRDGAAPGAREVLLVRRKWPPPGWALPGGFVDRGETLEQAVCRETLEETGLVVTKLRQFHAYSDPRRDPRHHTVGVVFEVETTGSPVAGDDAAECRFFSPDSLPPDVAFDHRQIVTEYFTHRHPGPLEPAPARS
jgi:ADP-ribose pyrophosphatase YjhB (NUDIX family)